MPQSHRARDELLRLAAELGVERNPQGTRALIREEQHVTPSTADINLVDKELSSLRTERFQAEGKRLFKRKPNSKDPCSPDEATTILEHLVTTSNLVTVGQVVHLLRLGASVNTVVQSSKTKRLTLTARRQDEPDRHSQILERAVTTGRADLVRALLQHADQSSLDNLVPFAVREGSFEIVRAVLAAGADPNVCCMTLFQNAVTTGQEELVLAITNGPKNVHKDAATTCLPDAVISGSINIVCRLLEIGAHVNDVPASALIQAVQRQRPDMVAALCVYEPGPSADQLTRAVALTQVDTGGPSAGSLQILQILLAAGATGAEVDELIVSATRDQHQPLIEALVSHVDPGSKQAKAAVRTSIEAGDLTSFKKMSALQFDWETASDLLIATTTVQPRISADIRLEMIRALTERNPSQVALDIAFQQAAEAHEIDIVKFLISKRASKEALATVLEAEVRNHAKDHQVNYELIEVLVLNGADVNVHQSSCVVHAVRNIDLRTLDVLNLGQFSASSLESMLAEAMALGCHPQRLQVIRFAIKAGVTGRAVDQALADVLDDSHDSSETRRLLLGDGGADVNFDAGKSIRHAVTSGNFSLLEQLLAYRPSSENLGRVLYDAISINDSLYRYQVCQIIVTTSPSPTATSLNQALLRTVISRPYDRPLVRLFLERGAEIDYDQGNVMRAAVQHQDSELLGILLTQSTSSETLISALSEVVRIPDQEVRLQLAHLLLRTQTTIDRIALGGLLPDSFDSADTRLLNYLLEKGASVNIRPPKAFFQAIQNHNEAALLLLMRRTPSASIVSEVFEYAWRLPSSPLSLLKIITNYPPACSLVPFDRYLLSAIDTASISRPHVEYLLQMGAQTSHADGESLRKAALQLDNEILALLLRYQSPYEILTKIFEEVIKQENIWSNPAGPQTARLLLSHEPQSVITSTLLTCIERYESHKNAKELFDLMLYYKADINHEDGGPLELAARTGNRQIVEKLLAARPAASTIDHALPYIFESRREESVIVQLIAMFARYGCNLNTPHKYLRPVIFLALKRYPTSERILQTLLQYGASPDQQGGGSLDKASGPEMLTPLLYALTRQNTNVQDNLLTILTSSNADVNFTTSKTKTNVLLEAVKQKREKIVKILLDRGADPAHSDAKGYTALCYASEQGFYDIAQIIVAQSDRSPLGYGIPAIPTDDGSLHLALLNGRAAIAAFLLSVGHDPLLTLPSFNNKSALILLFTHVITFKAHELVALLKVLERSGVRQDYRYFDKSLLVMALESPSVMLLVPAVLSWLDGRANDAIYYYHERSTGLVYSPMSYLMYHNSLRVSADTKTTLVNVLASYGCQEVLYNSTGGPQPQTGYSNAPAYIEAQIQSERRFEQDLRRTQHLAAEQRRLEEENHQRVLARQRQQHNLQLSLEREAHDQRLRLEHAASIQSQHLAATQRQKQLEYLDQQQAREFAHRNNMDQQEQNNKRVQLQLESQQAISHAEQLRQIRAEAAREQEEIEARSHKRSMREIEEKRTGMKEQSKLLDKQKKNLEYQVKHLRDSTQQLKIAGPKWDDPD